LRRIAISRSDLAVLGLALAAALIARAIAVWVLKDMPHVMDEVAYDLQSKTFASGSLALPVREPRGAFALWFVDDRREMMSIFPPGWPAVLALFRLAHIDGWANPVMHALATVLVANLTGKLATPRARVIAAAVYGLSPQAILLASSRMSHSVVALCAALVLGAGLSLVRGGRSLVPYLGGGLGLGMVVLTRPLCACVLGATLAIFGLVALRSAAARGGVVRASSTLLAPVMLAVVLLGAYNHRLTGHATRFPQSVYFDEHVPPLDSRFFIYRPGCNDLGFGHGCDLGIRDGKHTLKNAISNTGDNLTCWFLLAGGGPLVLVAALWSLRRREGRRELLCALAPVALVIPAYMLYWYAGTCFGARFYHAALPSLAVGGAIGLDLWARRPRIAATIAAAWTAWNAFALAGASREMSKAYWGTDDRFAKIARHWDREDALIMVAFRYEMSPQLETYFWTSYIRDPVYTNSVRALGALSQNDAKLEGRVVFAKYHPAFVAELRERFPKRTAWLYVVEDEPEGPAKDTLEPFADSPLRVIGDRYPPKENFDGYAFELAPDW
jgi:hypothetical protein